ncbi:MAG: metal-sulfur cluster assembly factor [Muribaculaceae bacterium]|nr:metal-sulfur cluster assembly factor [Muribaculaceae bacterium]
MENTESISAEEQTNIPGEAQDVNSQNGGEVDEATILQKTIDNLKTVFDPEIPVDIYSLGLVYKIDYTKEDKTLHVDMTLTAPSCPAADFILEDVRQKLVSIKGPEKVDLRLVFEPEWNQDMMSEEAKLELGFL